ncbi:MAG: hypothetical protein ABIA75_10025 [Candidatus Neomarinimicrobiota bacterium]
MIQLKPDRKKIQRAGAVRDGYFPHGVKNPGITEFPLKSNYDWTVTDGVWDLCCSGDFHRRSCSYGMIANYGKTARLVDTSLLPIPTVHPKDPGFISHHNISGPGKTDAAGSNELPYIYAVDEICGKTDIEIRYQTEHAEQPADRTLSRNGRYGLCNSVSTGAGNVIPMNKDYTQPN